MMRLIKHIKRIFTVIAVILLLIAVFLVSACMYMRTFFTSPVRIDTEGRLYYIDYTGDYSSPFVTIPMSIVKPVRDSGCSCFCAKDDSGGLMTARNYDLAHLDKNGEPTGLDVVVRCAPEGGYRSVAAADAVWLSLTGRPFYCGYLDDERPDTALLALLPYLCMDGINEKGLAVSILALDTKEGESAVYQDVQGKPQMILPVLMRKMLDSCASVDEAVKLAEDVNVGNIAGRDFHLFITDESGNSAVLEWRNNELVVTLTDIVTNFYVSSDDAEDCYIDGELKEKYIPCESGGYRFGYGHGYERFKTLMRMTDGHTRDGEKYMSMDDMRDILQAVSQEYTGELTSLTQYSTVYHNSEKSMDIWVYPDYSVSYHFDV